MDTSEISYRVADFLKQHAPFQGAELTDLLAMSARGRVRFHEQNEFVLWQGEPHRAYIYVIQQGTVSLWDESGGQSQLRDIRGAGDMLGLERYVGARSCSHTARSESDVVLYAFPAEDFETFLAKYPQAARYVEAEGRTAPEYEAGSDRRDPQHTFLHDVVGRRPLVTCSVEDSLADVAGRLLTSRSEALAVVDGAGRATGVLTAESVLRWAAGGGGDARQTLADLNIPAAAPPAIGPGASLSEGVLAMGSSGVDTLAVTDDGTSQGRLQVLITTRDLAPLFGEHPVDLLADIGSAGSAGELREINHRARAFALVHLNDPSSVDWLARLVHLVDRAIFSRLLVLVGAGGRACWCFAGSAGRAESLTRRAPQPVVLLDDSGSLDDERRVYQRVIEALLDCGYLPRPAATFEPDFYVATIAEWKTRYREWIENPVWREMYRARTLFDLRPVAGPRSASEAIEAIVRAAVDVNFVRILANDCLATLPPLTFFQDAVVEQEGEQVTTFHLERSALRPLVDVGRVFGMATGSFFECSTLERFAAARARLPEHQAIFREASDAMRVVLAQQARVGITQGTTGADLPPSLLSSYDRRILKGGFRSILRLLEFTNDPAWLEQL